MSTARNTWAAAFALVVAGLVFSRSLPPPERLLPELHEEPKQTPTQVAPFSVSADGVDYRIEPQFEYDIAGLVVSRHDTRSWWDMIHAEANDHLNVVDLCLVWGTNAKDGAYRHIDFSSGQYTCFLYYSDSAPLKSQHLRDLSNNHVLTGDAATARMLRGVRIGDQVRLRGQLAVYSHNSGFAFRRGTSTSRDDNWDGACETIFVDAVEVLVPAPAWPRVVFWIGILLLGLGLVIWYRTPNSDRAW